MAINFGLPHIGHLDLAGKVEMLREVAFGGYSDVHWGILRTPAGNKEVAIKKLRIRHSTSSMPRDERLKKRFHREVALWSQLEHPNIVPLLGFMLTDDNLPTLVSPWYQKGNIVEYLESSPGANRPQLLLDVAEGLLYLHTHKVVHGDLKGENILVNSSGIASLCDFGMSRFIDKAMHITGCTTTTQSGGTIRFMCPELLEDSPKTPMSDMWAFGGVILQIMLQRLPYQELQRSTAVTSALMRGDPPLPKDFDMGHLTEAERLLWTDVRNCWLLGPQDRPGIALIKYRIASVVQSFHGARKQYSIPRATPSDKETNSSGRSTQEPALPRTHSDIQAETSLDASRGEQVKRVKYSSAYHPIGPSKDLPKRMPSTTARDQKLDLTYSPRAGWKYVAPLTPKSAAKREELFEGAEAALDRSPPLQPPPAPLVSFVIPLPDVALSPKSESLVMNAEPRKKFKKVRFDDSALRAIWPEERIEPIWTPRRTQRSIPSLEMSWNSPYNGPAELRAVPPTPRPRPFQIL